MLDTLKKLLDILPDSDGWKFAALFGLMMIGTVLELAGIGMIPVFIGALSNPEMIFNNQWIGPVAAYLGIETAKELLIYGGIGLLIIFLVKGAYLIWFNYIKAKFIYNRFTIIASRLFETYLSAPYAFHLERNTAELIRNVTNETRFISNHVMLPFLIILMNAVTVTGIFLLLLFVEPIVTIIAFIIIGGGGGFFLKIIRNRLKKHGSTAANERSRMIQGVNEGLGGFKDVTVMNRQKLFLDRFKEYAKNLTQSQIFKTIAGSSSKPVIEFFAVSGLITIAFTMIWRGSPMGSIIPILALFGAATVKLMPAIQQIIMRINTLRYYVHALKPVHKDIKSMEDYYQKARQNTAIKRKLPFNDIIVLKNVCYRYPNSKEDVLKNINISILERSTVGFVGPTGAGKSTIVDVLLGLLDPNKGQVTVDGVDIKDEKRAWQNNAGYIPQFIYLSDDTIKNNIAFGIPDELISDEKVKAAVEAAQLKDFIENLPRRLNTKVGEDGVQLSGGQRQRVGIARALYNNPEVLIMDEGTSSLDNYTEKQVISAIEALKGERTIIMIAHRLTTVKNCDQLFMINQGEIVDKGTHDELLNRSKEFQKMSLA